jgi:hypothetical protein
LRVERKAEGTTMFNFEKLDVWQKAIETLYRAAEEQSKMLSGLRKSLLSK